MKRPTNEPKAQRAPVEQGRERLCDLQPKGERWHCVRPSYHRGDHSPFVVDAINADGPAAMAKQPFEPKEKSVMDYSKEDKLLFNKFNVAEREAPPDPIAAAPDHAREGALRVRVEALLADYRDILASLKTTMEQHRERVSGFTTLEAYRHHIDCTEIVVIKLERALADGKEGGE